MTVCPTHRFTLEKYSWQAGKTCQYPRHHGKKAVELTGTGTCNQFQVSQESYKHLPEKILLANHCISLSLFTFEGPKATSALFALYPEMHRV